jgi:hypothetical protein
MVEGLDWCGNSPKEVKAAMSRLVEGRMIEPVPTARTLKKASKHHDFVTEV